MRFEDLIYELESIAPSASQAEWDNSGIQIAVRSPGVKRVMTALEITDEIVTEAIEKEVDVIVTHHPLIFGSLSSIDRASIEGQYILDLIKNNISVYSSHTPFDKCTGGNNDLLAEELGLEDVDGFTVNEGGILVKDMTGRVGKLPEPLSLDELADILADAISSDRSSFRIVGELSESIQTVALCTGAGAEFIETAVDNQCDVLITGDVKYHDAQKARSTGLCLIDGGHYGTEKSFAANMAGKLRERIGDLVEIIEAETDIDPFTEASKDTEDRPEEVSYGLE